MPTSTRCSPEITGIARDARPDLIIHSGDLFDFLPPGSARPCPVPARAQRPVRGGAGRGGCGKSRLARAAGGPGIRRDGVRGQVRVGRPQGEVRRPGAACPATAGSWTTRHGTASSGSGWPRCRSSTRTGSWTTSPARPAAPATTPAACAISRPSCTAGSSTDASRTATSWSSPLTCTSRAPCRPGPSGPSRSSDTYLTEADALPPVSYAALGHIHRPQAVSRGGLVARYAGSPLQLDFGEAGEDKSVVVVDADPGRPVRVDLVPLQAGRRLADFTGTLEELRAQAAQIGSAFVRAEIVSERADPEPWPRQRKTPRRRPHS